MYVNNYWFEKKWKFELKKFENFPGVSQAQRLYASAGNRVLIDNSQHPPPSPLPNLVSSFLSKFDCVQFRYYTSRNVEENNFLMFWKFKTNVSQMKIWTKLLERGFLWTIKYRKIPKTLNRRPTHLFFPTSQYIITSWKFLKTFFEWIQNKFLFLSCVSYDYFIKFVYINIKLPCDWTGWFGHSLGGRGFLV